MGLITQIFSKKSENFYKSQNISRVIVKPFSKNRFELYEDYILNYQTPNFKLENFKINRGFLTDGATVPRIFWSLYPPNSPEYLTAAVIHDNLSGKADKLSTIKAKKQAFKMADEVFYYLLLNLNVRKSKALTFFIFVKLWHYFKLKYQAAKAKFSKFYQRAKGKKG